MTRQNRYFDEKLYSFRFHPIFAESAYAFSIHKIIQIVNVLSH